MKRSVVKKLIKFVKSIEKRGTDALAYLVIKNRHLISTDGKIAYFLPIKLLSDCDGFKFTALSAEKYVLTGNLDDIDKHPLQDYPDILALRSPNSSDDKVMSFNPRQLRDICDLVLASTKKGENRMWLI